MLGIVHPYIVIQGDTLSEIAQTHDVSLTAVEAANPQIRDFNLIFVGQDVTIPGAYSQSEAPTQPLASQQSPSPSAVPYGAASGGLGDIPGVPVSFSCIAMRESSDLANPAADGNAYGIIPASGYVVAGMSVSQQKQVVRELYQADGLRPWAADGCPGT